MSDLFKNQGITHDGLISFSPGESNKLVAEGAIIIDLRNPDYLDYKAFDVDNVINLPMDEFEEQMLKLDSKKYYILADTSGIHSRQYVESLQANGYHHVASMSGGFVEWERDGMPVRVDASERLSGSCACQLKPREKSKE